MTNTETEVEIFWPSVLPPDAALDVQEELQAAGIPTSCRLLQPRRGPEMIALVLLTSPPMVAFLEAVFGRVAEDAYQALGRFVQRLLHRTPEMPALHSVVFESSSGVRVVFTPGLPAEAFRKALSIVPGTGSGEWTWDPTHHQWLQPEGRSATKE